MSQNYEKAAEQWERYVYCRDNGHTEFIQKADKCDEYFVGEQWDKLVEQRLKNQGKPVLTINKTLATLATVFGEQIETKADIAFRPAREGNPETAEALTKVYLQIANNNDLDRTEESVAEDGFVTSRGFYDIRIGFDDHMQGEVKIKRINPRNVVIDPDATEYDPDEWNEVFVTKWLTFDDIEMLYSKGDADALRAKGASNFFNGYDSIDDPHGTIGGLFKSGTLDPRRLDARRVVRVIERQYRKIRVAPHFLDPQTGDTRPVPASWEPGRGEAVAAQTGLVIIKKRVQAIKWTVTADDRVLFDEWSPYKHFTVVPFFPFFRNGRTMGIVENLFSLQDALNKSASQELHVINTTANSGWKVKVGALQNMTIEDLEERGAETGLVLEMTDPKDAEKIQPNQIPTGLDRLSFKADNWIKEVSGVSDSQRGFDRADVAAKAIQAKQAAGSINLAKPLSNLAHTRRLVSERILDLVQKYYVEERIVQITGRGLLAETEELAVNQLGPSGEVTNDLTLGEYSVVVTTVPSRKNFEESQFQQAVQMRELGVAIPDAVLVENSFLARKTEIAAEIRQLQGGAEQSELEQQMAQLEMQAKMAALQESQADIEVKRANAALSAVRARKEAQEMMSGSQDQAAIMKQLDERELAAQKLQMEREMQAAKLALERHKIEQEIAMRRVELEAETELEEEKFERETEMKEAELNNKIQIARFEAESKREIAEFTARHQAETAKAKAEKPQTKENNNAS